MSTPNPYADDPLDDRMAQILKAWAAAPTRQHDQRAELLKTAAQASGQREPLNCLSAWAYLWKMFSFGDNESVIAPSMPKEMKSFQGCRNEVAFGLSVYALQNAICVGACLVRTN